MCFRRGTICAVFVLVLVHSLVTSIDVGATEATGPWIATMDVYEAPTSALVVGAGFDPGQFLHLTVTDLEGNAASVSIGADAEGEIFEYVPIDAPGLHTAEIRDDAGILLSTTPIFVAGR